MENIKIIFKVSNQKFELHAVSVREDSDIIEITSNIREPELHRGNVGDLCIVSSYYIDGTEVEDTHKDVLLQRIELWVTDSDNFAEWKYVFLKN